MPTSCIGPIGVLATHKELQRDLPIYGESGGWIARVFEYLDRVPPKHGGKKISRDRLWAVVQGYDTTLTETEDAVRAAQRTGVAAVVVARTRIDQSFRPQIISTK